jgi:ferredoxin
VALQDLAGWILKKLRLRPRHVDLGLLGWVPWLAFVYMFLQLVATRLLEQLGLPDLQWQMKTEDFWATFPNWVTAILTFGVVGFAIVWFLGNKGFCSYACPYGGIFGIADQLAPMRIRVTDACSGCGHCTAVCTSNVRVHQEVRDWKAVVDPGCMKCLDCVSVCPNDALYVGFGAPALFATRRTPAKAPVARERSWIVQLALTGGFFLAVMSTFLASNPGHSDFRVQLALVLTGFALLVALPFRGRQEPRRAEYTLGEEILLGLAFVVAMFGIRGQHIPLGLSSAPAIDFPFLFAMGLAAIFAYGLVQLVRLVRSSNVTLRSFALRAQGRLAPSGVAFAGIALPLVLLVGWRAWVHVDQVIEQHASEAGGEQASLRAQRLFEDGMRAAAAGDFATAEKRFREALVLRPDAIPARENLAGVLCAQNRFAEGIEQYRIALRTNTRDADTWAFLARAQYELKDFAAARTSLERALEIAPLSPDLHLFMADVCDALGDAPAAQEHRRRARELGPTTPR